jgi:hypothetical protein
MAKHLHALRMAKLSRRDELVRRVCRVRTAKEIPLLRLPPALLLLRAVAAHRACLFRAQPATANRLTRVPALHLDPRAPLYRPLQPHQPARDPRPLGSFPELGPDCPPRARQRALVAEHSWDFPL